VLKLQLELRNRLQFKGLLRRDQLQPRNRPQLKRLPIRLSLSRQQKTQREQRD
jgi:hypothetical protein